MKNFDKQAQPPEGHITLLQDRGLVIPAKEKAFKYLNNIGYYRLSAYFRPFFHAKDSFTPGTTFDDVLNLYIFDRKLRLLTIDAMERIEVAIRTAISNSMSIAFGPHWFLEKDLFICKETHRKFINIVSDCTGKENEQNQTTFCKHYYNTYSSPDYPPSWMVCECLPMGTWSKLYSNLETKHRRTISFQFDFAVNDFPGWIHSLTIIRNCVAHHARFWNTTFPPKAKNIEKYSYKGFNIASPYAKFVIIYAMLKRFTTKSEWPNKLQALIQDCPLDSTTTMGFPEAWFEAPFWHSE